MSGLTAANDPTNKITGYLSYSTTDGYTVLKSGWYFIDLYTYVRISGSSPTDLVLGFYINNTFITNSFSWTVSGVVGADRVAFPIYLNKNDKIYFKALANGATASSRKAEAKCYPMF